MRAVPYAAILSGLWLCLSPACADEPRKVPVILDTDIGSDIDDAFALGLLVASERYELLGVTTCGERAEERAWMVCRFLTALGLNDVPVAFGRPPQPSSEIGWQSQYRRHPAVIFNRSSRPAKEPAEALMQRLLKEHEGPGVTLLAIGPLTNVARLLEADPEAKRKIARIVLMGGSLRIGYDGRPPAVAEWNVRSDIPAARKVFDSGLPLLVAPLDVTASLRLPEPLREKLFSAHTPLTHEIRNLYQLWNQETPTLHDPVAVRLGFDQTFCKLQPMRLSVDEAGLTRIAEGEPNALVATELDGEAFLGWFVETVRRFGEPALPGPPRNPSQLVPRRGLPRLVHAFEDYDNDIERRWWMCGLPETDDLPAGSRRACRAVLTLDFDGRMGDLRSRYQAVIFNPVPGPPMGQNPRLTFRYKLSGTDRLRVQLYSLSNGYHRYLSLRGLPQDEWTETTVDMTEMRRPDGSGGPLAADERIDDIQFYIDPRAELVVDSMVLYDEAPEGELRPFPKRFLFTGWFDTGRQGNEWPGDFEIVPHEPPRTWKAAKSVLNAETKRPWVRLHLRGERRLAETTRLRFWYRMSGADSLSVVLLHAASNQRAELPLTGLKQGEWAEAELSFDLTGRLARFSHADELHFLLPDGAELQLDDLLLYEPAEARP